MLALLCRAVLRLALWAGGEALGVGTIGGAIGGTIGGTIGSAGTSASTDSHSNG